MMAIASGIQAAAIDPAAILQLVTLPGLADSKTGQQRQQRGDEGAVAFHQLPPA